jgi:N-methylhydantoinase A
MPVTYRAGVDIGGTFTDIVLRHSSGVLTIDKVLTTPHDLLDGFFAGVANVMKAAGIGPRDVDGIVVHATTIVTNVLIERKGRPAALLLTEGFRDVLHIRNEHRYEMFDPQIEFPDALVPSELTFGVAERMRADGTVLRAPDPTQVEALAGTLRSKGVESVAICFLNSYVNPDNERAVGRELAALLPNVFLTLSSDVAPQIREYPRASTAAVNAYTMPVSLPYLRDLSGRLKHKGFPNAPLIMLSSGGVVGAETAGRHPARMIESGPAAGALAACHYAEVLGIRRLMSFDMGGTTAKTCLIEDGEPLIAGMFEVDRRWRFREGSGLPVSIPSIDMIEIGAGGGSIARVDALGLLKVGPDSAGAAPGPACYGRGGAQPTVTDADLVLGLLDADNFLGGDMKLDRKAAEAAVGRIADGLKLSRTEAARGIFRVVTESMAAAVRTHATDRGVDWRGMPLFAFGGAGPLHACEVAALLQSEQVIVPPQPSVLSAFGTLVTSVRLDLVRSDVVRTSELDWPRIDHILGELACEATTALREAGCSEDSVTLIFAADLRYTGQQNELTVTLDADPRDHHDGQRIVDVFEAAYRKLYGINPFHVPIELVTWRVTARGPVIPFNRAMELPAASGKPRSTREVHAWSDGLRVPVYDRGVLAAGQSVRGPAIIEERETTTVIPPGWTATVDAIGCIFVRRG